MSKTVFKKLFPDLLLRKSRVGLTTYTGQTMKIVDEVDVQVSYQEQEPKQLTLVVVEGNGPTLLRCNWLPNFKIDWKTCEDDIRDKLIELDKQV